MNVEKYFNFYIYNLFLDCFSLIFVKIRWELSEIRGTERLFIDEFCHDVQQPSQSNITSTNPDVCSFATSLDYVSHVGKCLYWLMKTVAR